MSEIPKSKNAIFSVSQLNQSAADLLEQGLGVVWLEAEIGQFTAASSGHWYFSLKDNKAQVRCAMFRMRNRQCQLTPKQGDQVLVRARVGLYQPRGEFQLVVESMQPAGIGRLQQEFERLKQQLAAEGLFDMALKRAIPRPLRRLGVITSATGAAIHDVLTVLKKRDAAIEVVIYPSPVQGKEATAQIVKMIALADQRQEVDALLITRGGGSLEDLWCFNEQQVARAIANCSLPTISAVGHEVDVTIADLVADLRCPTPSAAAETLSQDQGEQAARLNHLQQRLTLAIQRQARQTQQQLQQWQLRLQRCHPQRQLTRQMQQLDELEQRLKHAQQRLLKGSLQSFAHQQQRLHYQHPQRRLADAQQRLTRQQQQLTRLMQQQLEKRRQDFIHQTTLLDAISPLGVLTRGYAIARKGNRVIRRITQVHPGDAVRIQLHDGQLDTQVVSIQTKGELFTTPEE